MWCPSGYRGNGNASGTRQKKERGKKRIRKKAWEKERSKKIKNKKRQRARGCCVVALKVKILCMKERWRTD